MKVRTQPLSALRLAHKTHVVTAADPAIARTIKFNVTEQRTLEEVVVAILLLDGQNRLSVDRLEPFRDHMRPVRYRVRRLRHDDSRFNRAA